ncbi:MAG: tRNA (adenosine(37)-N6)-threonylcarbamoyltransferase complex dimerization subunit type 1 TsaB [Candidatus Aureabacteria bacterium]|nr:tRNA (adenosine(37)-N6)-threonylcarbamoyltransferase complex dimerization subunit type 1 TsaB [Candidatus Auribacterota bacterium]
MGIIAITTTCLEGSVAVLKDGKIFQKDFQSSLMNHSARTVPAIKGVLHDAGTSIDEVSSVAVDIGPGSFTGIRLGLACAKAFSMALDIKVIGFSSLDIIAQKVCRNCSMENVKNKEYLVAIDAGRKEYYCSRYIYSDGSFEKKTSDHLATEEEVESVTASIAVYGYLHKRNLSTLLHNKLQIVFPSAESLIEASMENEKLSLTDENVMPNYIRSPNVILKKKK